MSVPERISPMLRHAIESFEHGVLHYLDGSEIGRKFALLHIDHAIELALKEKVARIGKSIFRRDGKTISVHEAYQALADISIPEKPRLEDLHDFRNIVQHKGLTPDEHTTEFYVTEAYGFLKRFLSEELGIVVQSALPRTYIKAMEGKPSEGAVAIDEVKRRVMDAEQLFATGAYEMAVVSSFVALEVAVRQLAKEEKPIPMVSILRRYVDSGRLDEVTWRRFKSAAGLRNKAAHTGGGISREQARHTIDDLHGLIDDLSKIVA